MICKCGSGRHSYELIDARGIYVSRVCEKCEDEVKSRYRPEIFEEMNYWTDEPVEEELW